MTGPADHPTERREATPSEFRALASPLRLRILRLCLHRPLTNREIADHLQRDPATTLHHVRMLVDAGFLAAEPVRRGKRGSREKPYRATGKSWVLSASRPEDALSSVLTTLDALRGELIDAGAGSLVQGTRLGLQLSEDELAELAGRLQEVIADYADREPMPDGVRVGLNVILHRQP